MKICHITSVHSENDTRIFLKECTSLAQAGFEVHYIVPGAVDSTSNGVQIHGVKVNDGSRLNRMTKTVDTVYKKALEINASLYHFHDPELIPIALKLKKNKKIVLYDIHEDLPRAILSKKWISPMVRKPLSAIFEYYENRAAKKFDYLITATPYITERFKKINDRTINVNNYPLLKELQSSDKISQETEINYVSYVGGLVPIRGSSELIKSARLISGNIKVAGPINTENLKNDLKRSENIEYLGILSRDEVKNLLSRSKAGMVTFLPEPNHINAQPNKMFEYMSASIPVICSDFPLWRSIIEDADCGLCVDPENAQTIADAINYVFENPEIALKMGKNGRKAVELKYNWEAESVKLIDIYKKF
ncbi:glycosyltransferase family 4 protein [Planomicrobium okeanokoites]|uniref:Glycosyltransferase family 4 protein n=1 Tax=Planomicrobium okeanokoites TaxID=244 RepID=A0ABV7KNL2_PLAOK|nr:glycosyltransferase family 4 protein [Planomicrobium okeanokoites]TAA66083.1 glycosyltransferase [Planomicrobium okeanokoites]